MGYCRSFFEWIALVRVVAGVKSRSDSHTNSIRIRASHWPKIFRITVEVISMGMYVVWLSPSGCGGFTGISRDAQMCFGFPPPQAALVTVASGERVVG